MPQKMLNRVETTVLGLKGQNSVSC